tara:strand:+ start:107 stop:514 length:408 start_codon:yes stop_codon:yes gene_type:complete
MALADIPAKLDEFGIMPTPQRVEIAEILLQKPQHLSADQIIGQLRSNGSRVSKATVYNTLNLFGKCGLIRECMVDPERRLYDSCIDAHHHFYNVDTGQLVDIPADDIEVLGLPALPEGTQCEGLELFVRVRNVDD